MCERAILDTAASVLLCIERLVSSQVGDLAARTLALRVVVSRLGEQDARGWWASRIWGRGELVFGPVFARSWSRQRLVLALAGARVAETGALAGAASGQPSLFRLDAAFDAALDHSLEFFDLETAVEICNIVDEWDCTGHVDLASLAALPRCKGDGNLAVAGLVDRILQTLGTLESNSWPIALAP